MDEQLHRGLESQRIHRLHDLLLPADNRKHRAAYNLRDVEEKQH